MSDTKSGSEKLREMARKYLLGAHDSASTGDDWQDLISLLLKVAADAKAEGIEIAINECMKFPDVDAVYVGNRLRDNLEYVKASKMGDV